jgi:iron complex outermembrane receptor protein
MAVSAGLAALCAALAAPAHARKSDPAVPRRQGPARKSYAQELVDKTVARHPELIGLDLHATPPNGTESVIIASISRERIGRKTDPDDLQVFKTGQPRVQIDGSGKQEAEVVLQLQDVIGRPIGLARMIFPQTAGTDAEALVHKAREINEDIAEQIPTGARLLEAAWVEQSEDDEDLQTLPMTKAVVTGKALEQSQQEGYSEAVKNVAGVAPGNSKGTANDSIYIRGIKLNLFSNYRLNGGLPTAGVLTSPTEDKERIVALKGANALMFGVASPAGIINLVTKRAGDKDVTSLSLLGNSFGQIGASADVGRRFFAGKQLGVRANASVVRLENGVRHTDGDGEFASLGVDWKAHPRLALQGDFEYYAKHVPEQGGVSLLRAVNGVVPITPVPDPRNLLSGRWAKLRADTKNVQLRADFILLDGWKVMAEAGRSYAYRSRFTVRISDYDIDTGAGGIVRVNTVKQEYTNSFERAELLGKFPTWFLRHDLTIGVSRSRRESATPGQNNITLTQRQNIYHPIELDQPVFTGRPTSLPVQVSQDIGVYGYDTISLGPKLKFLLGLRITRDREDNGVKKIATTVATPAVGALYDVLPALTLFASFMEGLEGGATAPVNAVNAYEILPSAVSTQKEIGIRVSDRQDISASASAFQITRANAVTDPTTMVFAQNGDIDYKGIEATLSVEFLRRWTFDAAGQWMRAIQRSPDPTINGLVPENTPKLLGNVRLAFRVPWVAGLSLNAGASGVTRRFVNPQNQNTIPGYVLYNAGIGYQTRINKARVAFQVTVDNIANLRYWNSVQTGTYGTGMDRSFKMSVRVGF